MKHNGTQGTYHSVPQTVQSEEVEEPKKAPSHESVVENGQNVKSSPTPLKELQEEVTEDEKKPMSPLRKFCFVLSLLQCVLFIVAFGWLIPCKIPRHSDKTHYSHNWEMNFYGEDIVTNLAVTSISHKPVAVIFGFTSTSNSTQHGIRAVNAFDGSNIWETNVDSKPVNIVCDSGDIVYDGVPDCVVTDEEGKMFAVNVRDGQHTWYMHEHPVSMPSSDPQQPIIPQSISTPIIAKSCFSSSERYVYAAVQDKAGLFYFVSVSGTSGQVVKRPELPECAQMPQNIMWYNGKDDPDEIEPSQELAMSCTNKGGKVIIYKVNINEFCKNDTNLGLIFFKLDIVENPTSPLNMKLLNTDDGDNVVVLTQDQKIKLYNEDKKDNKDVQFSAESGIILNDFIVGHFTNSSLANVFVLSQSDSTQTSSLLLLDSKFNKPLVTVLIENGTATALFTVHKMFNSFDTVLLKTVSESSDDSLDNLNVTDRPSDVKYFDERYTILECFDTGTFRTVSKDLTIASCPDSKCQLNQFKEKPTAIVVDVDDDTKAELIYFTHKTHPSAPLESVTLKLARLSDPQESCSSCHC